MERTIVDLTMHYRYRGGVDALDLAIVHTTMELLEHARTSRGGLLCLICCWSILLIWLHGRSDVRVLGGNRLICDQLTIMDSGISGLTSLPTMLEACTPGECFYYDNEVALVQFKKSSQSLYFKDASFS